MSSGLKHWPAGEMERNLRAGRKREIAAAREFAELSHDVEVRDGREYLVVRLDDAYDERQRVDESEIRYHRHAVQVAHELTRGTGPIPRGNPL